MKTFIIDGERFADLDGFYDEVGAVLCPGFKWGRNLDAFNDILHGGFGAFDFGESIRLVWRNSAKSKSDLGYPETLRRLRAKLSDCHPSARENVRNQIDQAAQTSGPTVFHWLLELIEEHHDHVELVLE